MPTTAPTRYWPVRIRGPDPNHSIITWHRTRIFYDGPATTWCWCDGRWRGRLASSTTPATRRGAGLQKSVISRVVITFTGLILSGRSFPQRVISLGNLRDETGYTAFGGESTVVTLLHRRRLIYSGGRRGSTRSTTATTDHHRQDLVHSGPL
jgi:hypothetical protein